MLWRVHPETVNLVPLGKQSWFDSKLLHQFWLVHIMAIISDCLSEDGSSILPRVAKFVVSKAKGEWASQRESHRRPDTSPATLFVNK